MRVSKLLLPCNSIVLRGKVTKASRLAVSGIFLAAALAISLCFIFLLWALTPEEELRTGIKLCKDGKYEITPVPMEPKGLLSDLNVEDMHLTDMTAPSGKGVLKPLPSGEPGGRVIGRGRDIQGVFRLVRIKHELADWWADQSSLVAFTDWLNKQTRIKTDI